MKTGKMIGLVVTALAGLGLSGCRSAAALSCEQIAKEATEVSKQQPVQITGITNLKEISKTDKQKRCSGTAQTSAGTTEEVVLKGYEDENGNQMVAYEGQGPSQ